MLCESDRAVCGLVSRVVKPDFFERRSIALVDCGKRYTRLVMFSIIYRSN